MARKKKKQETRKKRRDTKKPKEQAPSSGSRLDPQVAARILSSATTILLIGAIAVGLVVGRRAMLARVETMKTETITVRFNWPPLHGDPTRTWMNNDSREELEAIALSWLEPEHFDDDSLRQAHQALMRTGWFASPCTLERTGDGVVRVNGRWRTPTAVVRCAGKDRLVSRDGVRLPPEFELDRSNRKVILGAERTPLPEFGERWEHDGVQAAIDLLAQIVDIQGAEQILGVDVSRFGDRAELTIVTDRSYRILWGGTVDKYHPGQATPSVKRQRLIRIHEQYGRIDANRPFIDISLETGVEIDYTARDS